MKNIEQFIEKVVEEKGFDKKDPEVVAQIKADLTNSLEDRINAMILSNLPEDALTPFEKVLDGGNEEELNTFVKQYIPDLDEKLAVEMLTFKNMYL